VSAASAWAFQDENNSLLVEQTGEELGQAVKGGNGLAKAKERQR